MTSGKKAKQQRQGQTASPYSADATPRQSRLPLLLAIGLVVVLCAVIGGVLLANRGGGDDGTPAGAPRGAAAEDKGIRINSSPAKAGAPTLDIYEDFMCPSCAKKHLLLSDAIKGWAKDGHLTVVYNMKAMLGPGSLRAANASACAAEQGTDKFLTAHHLIMQRQQMLIEDGMKEDTLKAMGSELGLQGDNLKMYEVCVRKERFTKFVEKVEKRSANDGVSSTPSFFINGKNVDVKDVVDVAEFAKRIFGAANVPVPASTPASKGSSTVSAPVVPAPSTSATK